MGIDPAFVIGNAESGNGAPGASLYVPAAVDFDSEGNLYVFDVGDLRVAVFSQAGDYLRSFGGRGEGPGEFNTTRADYNAEIDVHGNIVGVLERLTNRVHLFTLSGEAISTFAVGARPVDLALGEERVLLSFAASSKESDALVEYGFDGAPERVIAKSLFDSTGQSFAGRGLNASYVGLQANGEAVQAFANWPLLRFYGTDQASDDQWFDLQWWGEERWSAGTKIRRNAFMTLVEKQAALLEPDHLETLRSVLVDDLAYASRTGEWAILLQGGIVQLVTAPELEPGPSYILRVPGGDHSPIGRPVIDVAVSPDGRTICGASPAESLVLCYEPERTR